MCVCGAYVGVSVAQQLVEDVAELPAQDGVAGQRQPVDGGPEGVSALLMVGAQDAGWGRGRVKEAWHSDGWGGVDDRLSDDDDDKLQQMRPALL